MPGASSRVEAGPDPRLLLLAAGLSMLLLLALSGGSAAVLAALVFGLAVHRGGRRPLLGLAAGIGGLTVVLHAFTEPGPVLFRVWFLAVTRTGILAGAERGSRLIGLAAVGWLLARELGIERLADLAARSTWPLERRWPRLAGLGLAAELALRFLPEIEHEVARLRLAQAARPQFPTAERSPHAWRGRLGGGLIGRLGSRLSGLESLFLPLLAGTVRRAGEVARTLDARGYGSGPRTSIVGDRLTAAERGLAAAMVTVAAVVLAADTIARLG